MGTLVLLLTLSFGSQPSLPAGRAPASFSIASAVLHEPVEGAGIAVPQPVMFESPHSGLRVQVPALGIDLAIVEGDGQDPSLNLAAHYPGMKWPGEGGRSFLYAHARPGMFGPLLGARPVGAEVDVTEPGGAILRYVISSYTDSWPVTDTSILSPSDHEELVLYTCTSWTYEDPKIVAIAIPKT